MTEQEAILKAQEIYKKDMLFIILSKSSANLVVGVSIPFVGMVDDKKILFVFDGYEKAKDFVKAHKMELQNDIYPVAQIDKNSKGTSLKAIIDIALSLGIEHMEYNSMSDDVLGVHLAWFLQANDLKHDSVSIMVSAGQFKDMQEGKNISMNFNPMKILNIKDPYEIDDTRKKELLNLVFDAGETVGDYRDSFDNLSLIECLLLLDCVTTKFIPRAMNENKPEHVQYFNAVEAILQEVVLDKVVVEKKLFTAIDPETNYYLVKDQSVYVFITDKYEKAGKYKYEEIKSGIEGIRTLIRETYAERLIITDGPRYLGIIPTEKVEELLFKYWPYA